MGFLSLESGFRVRVRTAGAHLRSHPYRLHELPLVGALAQRGLRVAQDAARALCDVSDGHRDELLRLLVERAVGNHLPVNS
jgi:hypothetical protein